jgi:hypothetical protein
MNSSLKILTVFAASAMIGSGCVSFPKGTEIYTAEFPSFISPSNEAPEKTFMVDVAVEEADESHCAVIIGLVGKTTSSQSQVQHYDSVTVEKKKQLGFGFVPGCLEDESFSGNKLRPTGVMEYQDGAYKMSSFGDFSFWTSFIAGELGLVLYVPFALLYEPFFGSWECHSHHWVGKNVEYLSKFSPEERRKIGVWTSFDNEKHRPAPARWAFSHMTILGFHRYCDYEIHNPIKSDKTTPLPPKITTVERPVSGPYTVTLELPVFGFKKSVEVPPGQTLARIALPSAEKGHSFANGTIRIQLPPGALGDVHDADDRALIELATQREWPVAVALPSKR